MKKQKRIAFVLGSVVLAAVLAVMLLPESGSGNGSGHGRPAVQEQTVPQGTEQTRPVQTAAPETTEPMQTEASRPAGTTLPPADTEPVQTEPAQTQPVQTESEPTQPVQTEPVQTEPVQTEPVQTEPAQTQPVQTEPRPTQPVQTEPAETQAMQTEPAETEPVLTVPPTEAPELFPVLLEDGMLTVQSVFQFSGMNPDADWQFGENIAGIQLVNTSGQHLRSAEITAVLADGTALSFLAEDVAPGMGVMAFSLEHGILEDPALCAEVYGYAEFEEDDPLRTDLVELRVEGVEVTVKNVSDIDLTNLEIICHGLLDGSCFGGRTYSYYITSLSEGASTTILAEDCILGMAQVARVELGE